MITRHFALCFSFLTFVFTMTASAAMVRGRVFRSDGQPYAGVKVAVESAAAGRSATTLTADDGLFQLNNIPPGDYVMEVRTSGSTTTYRITVDQRQVVDVAPVTVR